MGVCVYRERPFAGFLRQAGSVVFVSSPVTQYGNVGGKMYIS